MVSSDGAGKAAKLLKGFQDISFFEIGLAIAVPCKKIVLLRRGAPYFAKRGPQQLSLWLFGAVQIARLLLRVAMILWIIPIIYNVTLPNFLVTAGAASVAVGFAFRDYESSLLASVVAIFEHVSAPTRGAIR